MRGRTASYNAEDASNKMKKGGLIMRGLIMRFNRAKRLVSGMFVAVLLLFGAGAVTTAHAQVRVVRPRVFFVQRPFFPRWHYGYPYYYNTVYDPIAYQREQGYSDGLSRGKDDARHGRPDDPNNHSHYRNSSSVNYREAFLQGYADGYGQRAG